MKTLNQYIKESILDDEEDIINSAPEVLIKEFILKNYDVKESYLKIKKSSNKYIVDCSGHVEVSNLEIEQLTNGLFEWGVIKKYFDCYGCKSLTSLEGAPKEVGWDFYCHGCTSLKSLQGAPERVKRNFDCSNCTSLKSLNGAPKEVGAGFSCSFCNSLTSLQGAPERVDWFFKCHDCKSLKDLTGAPKEVGWDFKCHNCKSLKDLTGAPKEVGAGFNCYNCGTQFEEEDVEKVSKVKGKIIV